MVFWSSSKAVKYGYKRRADSKRKRVAETWKLLKQEKNKAEGYRVQIDQLEKQVSEAKQKLKFKMSAFKAATKKVWS